MKVKRTLSFLLTLAMLVSMLSGFAVTAAEGEHCADAANCTVCTVAAMINALPEADAITVENAAEVTDQIHAIDRVKFTLSDDEYNEMLALVNTEPNTSGGGLPNPALYVAAVEKINSLTGSSCLVIAKKFADADGNPISAAAAQAEFTVTNVDSGAQNVLTLSEMEPWQGSLSADANYYSESADGDGWTYRYYLPAGTYTVTETASSFSGVASEPVSVSYNNEETEGTTVILTEGEETAVSVLNGVATYKCTFVVRDTAGEKVPGVTVTLTTAGNVVHTFATGDEEGDDTELASGQEYTMTVTVPESHTIASDTFVFQGGNAIPTTDNEAVEYTVDFDTNTCSITITLTPVEESEFTDPVYYTYTATDADGALLSNASVDIYTTDWVHLYSHSTDDTGKVTFALERGTEYIVELYRPDGFYKLYTSEFLMAAGSTLPEGTDEVTFTEEADGIVSIAATFRTFLTEGNAEVTINFFDREGLPLAISGEYEIIYMDTDGSRTGHTLGTIETPAASWTMSSLGDGVYSVDLNGIDSERADEGYVLNSGWCEFEILDGKLVTVDSYDEVNGIDHYAPDASSGTVSNIDAVNSSFDLAVRYYTFDFAVAVPGLNASIPYEVRDENNELVEEDFESGFGTFLDPGTYTIYAVKDESDTELENYVVFPDNDTGVSFTVYEDYTASFDDPSTNGEIDNEDDTRHVCRYLEPKDSMTVTAKITTADGSNFAEGTYVQLNDENNVIKTETLPTDTNTATFEWTVSSMQKVWIDDEEHEDGGYYEWLTNYYYVDGTDEYGTIYFAETDTNVWEATVAGASSVRYSVYTDAYEGGYVDASSYYAAAGEIVQLFAYPDDGYEFTSLTVTSEDGTTTVHTADSDAEPITFTMPAYNVTVTAVFSESAGSVDPIEGYSISIASVFVGGTVEADKTTAAEGELITLTATPDDGYELTALTVTDIDGNVLFDLATAAVAYAASSEYYFEMPASDVTVDATFTETAAEESVYTVTASEAQTADVLAGNGRTDVYADDTVTVEVIVSGGDFTNADWSLVYDSDKFTFKEAAVGSGVTDSATVTFDNTAANVLSGKVRGNAGTTSGDELANGAVVAVYTFTAKAQYKDEVTGTFAFSSAHVNNYEMAGVQDNTPAKTLESCDVTIIFKNGNVAGSITASTAVYNGQLQAGNPFVLEPDYEDKGVIITYSTDGVEYYTEPPMWKEVDLYTYYAKVEGAGLEPATFQNTFEITPKAVKPTVSFRVDPDVSRVEITPIIEDVVDDSYTGTVTVTIGEATYELTMDQFTFDGTSEAVANEPIVLEDQVSGTLSVTVTYTSGPDDNYADGTGTETVEVDKITADDPTIAALEKTIVSIFEYDGQPHNAVIDSSTLTQEELDLIDGWDIANATIVNAYSDTGNITVTNVGDQELVKVTFTDTTNKYNDVVIYAVLKVTPRKVTITVADADKKVGDTDPTFTYTITLDSDPAATNALVAEGDLGTITTVREPGEAAGEYVITASYKPNTNYEVKVDTGTLTIGAPEYLIEVVDLRLLTGNAEETTDYIAGHRMILVYTNAANAYFTVEDANMFDVTAAGYKYVDNDYEAGTANQTTDTWKHVYAMVVAADMEYAAPLQAVETWYMDKVEFVGSDAAYKPEKIVYDEDINLTGELDVNDYSMTNGVYNVLYDRAAFIRSILKADYDHSKKVDTTDAEKVKAIVDAD